MERSEALLAAVEGEGDEAANDLLPSLLLGGVEKCTESPSTLLPSDDGPGGEGVEEVEAVEEEVVAAALFRRVEVEEDVEEEDEEEEGG